jgi:WD40 repeat protein
MAAFDPYRKWLGIPLEEQPPDHYRLLGIARFESDPDVISNAADRQMVHVRSFQSGGYSSLSQKLLNELAAARVCLLDPKKRGAYDEQLRSRLADQSPAPAPPPAAPPPSPSGEAVAPAVPRFETVTSRPTRARATKYAARRKKSNRQGPVITLGLVLLSLIIALVAIGLSSDPSEEGPKPGNSHNGGTRTNVRGAGTGNDADDDRDPSGWPGVRPDYTQRGGDGGGFGEIDLSFETPAIPPLRHSVGEMRAFRGLGGPGTDAVLTPNGEFILGASEDASVRLWDVRTVTDRRLEGSESPVLVVAASPDGKQALATTGRGNPPSGGEILLWDVVTGEQTHRINLSKAGAARDAEFSPDGTTILLACQDGTIRVFDAAKNREVQQIGGHDATVRAAAFTGDGARIVSGSEDGTVRVWDANTRAEQARLTGHKGTVTSVDVAADGSFAVSGGADRSVRLWDLARLQPLKSLEGHNDEITSVAVSPDGRFALSGSTDGAIRLWKVPEGAQVYDYRVQEGGVRSVAFSADGRMAVSTGDDATVRLWGLPEPDDLPPDIAGNGPEAPDELGAAARLPVPDAKALKDAETQVRNVFGAAFKSADTRAERAALARKLLGEGTKPQADLATIYVLLRLAWNEATKAGATDVALAAVDEMGRRFDVDSMTAKAKTLRTLAGSVVGSTRRRILVKRIAGAADGALLDDAFSTARELLATAADVAEKARDGALLKEVADRIETVAAREQQYQGVERARETLKATPEDPAAHETIGRYVCFLQGRWKEGLPHLAEGADATLKKLAETDLAGPDVSAEQVGLADGWWDVAERQPAAAREQVRARAAKWYRAAAPQLSAFDKTRAEQRLAEVDRAGQGGPTAPVLPSFSGFECRRPDVRVDLLLALGGNDATEAAVERALEWIVAQQHPRGFWTFTLEGPRGKSQSPNPGTLDAAPNAATALALLPLMAAGNDGRVGDYRREVVAGLAFLRTRLAASTVAVSHLSPRCASLYEPDAGQMPSHALGTIVLCEAAAMTGNLQTKAVAQAAANFLVATQNQDGGWGFQPDLRAPGNRPDPSDVYATAWNVAALKSADWAGLDVPTKVLQLAGRFLEDMKLGNRKGYGRGARNRHPPDPTATAAAVYTQMLLGWPRDEQQVVDYAVRIAELGPSGGSQLYQDFYHLQILREVQGPQWPAFNRAMRDWLFESQALDGPAAGSWHFDAPGWSVENGGRLFCTAAAALMLQTYYRNPLLYPTGG